MTNLLILMAWTLLLAIGLGWYLRAPGPGRTRTGENSPVTEADVVAYMVTLTPEQLGDLGDKVYDARMP